MSLDIVRIAIATIGDKAAAAVGMPGMHLAKHRAASGQDF
jgi:hypothetical protein